MLASFGLTNLAANDDLKWYAFHFFCIDTARICRLAASDDAVAFVIRTKNVSFFLSGLIIDLCGTKLPTIVAW